MRDGPNPCVECRRAEGGMSYCRWSSDDYGCDLYVYGSDAGIAIYVAARRVVGDVPHLHWPESGDPEEIERAVGSSRAQHAFLETAQREPIALPHAGESFCEATCGDAVARLRELRALGYRFPDSVFEDLERDAHADPATAEPTDGGAP